jgi:hypothetical protein
MEKSAKIDIFDVAVPLHEQLRVPAAETADFEADRQAIERLKSRKVLSANEARAAFNRLYHLVMERFSRRLAPVTA